MGYDRGDSFPYDFEPNGIPFDSKSKGNLSPRPYPIQCERKWKHSFLIINITIATRFQNNSQCARHFQLKMHFIPNTLRGSHIYRYIMLINYLGTS